MASPRTEQEGREAYRRLKEHLRWENRQVNAIELKRGADGTFRLPDPAAPGPEIYTLHVKPGEPGRLPVGAVIVGIDPASADGDFSTVVTYRVGPDATLVIESIETLPKEA